MPRQRNMFKAPISPLKQLIEGRNGPSTDAGGFSGALDRSRSHRRIHRQGRRWSSPGLLLLVGRRNNGASHTGRGKVLGGKICQDGKLYAAGRAARSAMILCPVLLPT